jgi:acetate kinase
MWRAPVLTNARTDGPRTAGAPRIDRGVGPAIWNIAVDEERELTESATAWI